MTLDAKARRERGRIVLAAGSVLGLVGLGAVADGFLFGQRIEDLSGTAQLLERWCGFAAFVVGALIVAIGLWISRRRD